MKVFLGWSGNLSHRVALTFRDWLPQVIQSVRPYVSSEDIAKGARWSTDLAKELQASSFGIICVTKENAESPWINFEAGALSKEIEQASVVPFLFNVTSAEIRGPLVQFQCVVNDREDILKLVSGINARQAPEAQLEAEQLERAFTMWWPQLHDALTKVAKESDKPSHEKPDQGAMVEEILDLTRLQQRESAARAAAQSELLFSAVDQLTQRLDGLTASLSGAVRSLDALQSPIRTPLSPPVNNLRTMADLLQGPFPNPLISAPSSTDASGSLRGAARRTARGAPAAGSDEKSNEKKAPK